VVVLRRLLYFIQFDVAVWMRDCGRARGRWRFVCSIQLRLQQICRFSSALDAISGGRFSGDLFVSSGGSSLCSVQREINRAVEERRDASRTFPSWAHG
jgi:hypothetical protein